MTINGKGGLPALLQPIQNPTENQSQVSHFNSSADLLSHLNSDNFGGNILMLMVAKMLIFGIFTIIPAPATSLPFSLMHPLDNCFAPQHSTHNNRLSSGIHSYLHNMNDKEFNYHNFHMDHKRNSVIILVAEMLISGVYLFFSSSFSYSC